MTAVDAQSTLGPASDSRTTAGESRPHSTQKLTLAYVAGIFPALSETFVSREVIELRRRGWTVHPVTLRKPTAAQTSEESELGSDVITAYGNPARVLGAGLAEALTHPLRTIRTLAMVVRDGVLPQGSTPLLGRLKTVAQGLGAIALARPLRRAGVEHIHCHFAHSPTTMGMYVATQLGVSFSFTGHANDLFERQSLLSQKLRRAAFVSSISNWHRRYYAAVEPDPGDKYKVIRCGVNVEEWVPAASRQVGATTALNVLTVCRLVPKKGVDVLIRALREFGRRYDRPWVLRVVGDGPERTALVELCRELGCKDSVAFLGACDNEEVRREMARADVFALTSRVDAQGDRDGIPVVLMEAMACGIPVIAGDIPSIRELVLDRVTGLCVDPGHLPSIVEAFACYAEEPALRREVAARARRLVEREFSLATNIDRMELALGGTSCRRGNGVAYLNTLYPAMSHTFIEREVRALRARHMSVKTFSIRTPAATDVLGEAHRTAAAETTYLLDSMPRLLATQLRQLIPHPVRYARLLLRSQRLAPPGLRARCTHLFYAMEATRLATEMGRHGLRHVHVHMANNGASVALLACAFDRRLTYSMTIHGSAEFFMVKQVRLKDKAEGATFVRCISDFCRSQVMAWTDPLAWERFHVVHCGVDPLHFSPTPPSPDAVASTGPLRLVTVGRLEAVKGYPVLLDACAELTRRGVDWELTMIGDGSLRDFLTRYSERPGLANRVRLVGPASPELLPRHLSQTDVMVISSFMEGVPVVLMEAMASGLAVVATGVGGIPELVEDGVSGLLVRPSLPASLADAIERLATDRRLIRQLGTAGRQKVISDFSIDAVGKQVFDLFVQYGLAPAPKPESAAGTALVQSDRTDMIKTLLPASRPPVSLAARPGRQYCLITPCRDEAAYAIRTLESIVNQTCPPARWVIVDDGSTDETPQILAEYAAKYDFIKVIRREDRGRRSVGPGVVDAFYAGYQTINPDDFDYVCKLDLDLDIPHGYFEELMRRMKLNPRIGTCSGKAYFRDPRGHLVSEACGSEMSVGMIKFYRTDCFRQIGGFVREVMWDGIDCHRCRMLGWIAVSWDAPEIRFEHLRPMGSSHKGIWTGRMRHGFGQYFMGTGLAYMTASALFRMTRPPVVVGGMAMWWGFTRSMLARKTRYDDRAFRKFVRRYQWDCLFLGKAAATMRLNERQSAVWESLAAERVALSRRSDIAVRLATDLLRESSQQQVPPAAGPAVPVGLAPTALVDVPPAHRPPTAAGTLAAPKRVILGGLPIDNVTMAEAIVHVESLVRAGQPAYVVTPNVDHVIKFQRDPALREAYAAAAMSLPDGMPLLWAARAVGTPLREKVSGSDVFPKLCEIAAARGYRIFLLGGLPGSARRAADVLRQRHPGLGIDVYCPPMGFERNPEENEKAVEAIRAFKPDILFVGLGAPKQEVWMHRHHREYGAPVSVGVGGSFEFVAGVKRRAPILLQRTGFEWAWRLMLEPRRMYRRYLIEDPAFFLIALRQRRARPTPPMSPLWQYQPDLPGSGRPQGAAEPERTTEFAETNK